LEWTRSQDPPISPRAGRWSARHWKTATFGWLAIVALVTVLGALAGTSEISDADSMSGESARAQRIIDGAGFRDVAMEVVLVQSPTERAESPAFRRTVEHTVTDLSAISGVQEVR
jgi:putative drug exporter of the RND superfamily